MKFFGRAVAIFAGTALFFVACTTTKTNEVPPAENLVFLTNDNAAPVISTDAFFRTAKPLVFPHRLEAKYRDNNWATDGVLKISSEGLRLIATSPAGRIFTLDWGRDGKLYFEKKYVFGANINAWYLLMDLTLIFGDAETLAANFSSPWKFEEKNGVRTLFCGNEKIAEIEFSPYGNADESGDTGNLRTRILLKNFVRGYEYFLTEF